MAIALATFAAALLHATYALIPNFHSDFEQTWFGASALLHGANPYALVGPGRVFEWPWQLYYPATAFVAAFPLTVLSAQAASTLFMWLSTFALAYGSTRSSWHRLPLFASASFIYSARLAQWSILMTAAIFVPALAALVIAKPQAGIPVLASSSARVAWLAGGIGSLILIAVSLAVAPGWPREWLRAAASAHHIRPPVTFFGGPAILLCLFRWRRTEAWLILILACLPQTSGWYGALMLLAVPRTYREACILSLVSTAGVMLTNVFTSSSATIDEAERINEAFMVAFCYVPAMIAVVRHPNTGETPFWLRAVTTAATSKAP